MMALPSGNLRGGLIISVQAPEGSPIRDPEVIAAIAEASLLNGAIGVRLEGPEHIGAVRRRCPEALIIGFWKRTYPGSSVYITPCWKEVSAVWSAGADVIALDATSRVRPDGVDFPSLLAQVQSEISAPLMADVDNLEDGLRAAELGCDWIGTTLYGHTGETALQKPPALGLLTALQRELPTRSVLICEGGIGSPTVAQQALLAGAQLVVVGTAITGVDCQVAAYCSAMTAVKT
ncbi:putative N-acetylmannosamine-6-phosphate 2-epimerase [cyanobiont of Ornithocercus magnificus]|nr:putative N-acetylmannosamine-6-phosphate 2-epimerase [cyanobiont of Ornithocercus magnificus]